jgi:TonB family protein
MTVTNDRFASETGSSAADFFDWRPEDARFAVHMHRDAIDGITRDVIEGVKSLPHRGLEVGGLLLGRVIGDSVWIERYKRILSNHRFGPQYILDDEDRIVLESTARSILEAGELAVVGFYRSHARADFDLDDADRDLVHRYFADPHDLVLLIRPENGLELEGRFFARRNQSTEEGEVQALGEPFPFQGRGISVDALNFDSLELPDDPQNHRELSDSPDEAETRVTHAAPMSADFSEREPADSESTSGSTSPPPRRIIPDFLSAPVEPSHTHDGDTTGHLNSNSSGLLGRGWPVIAAVAVVLGAAAFFVLPGHHSAGTTTPLTATSQPARPLGLYVSPAGNTWRVSWNPNATALHDARSVQLFVREGDDQNRIELTANDLASGTYEYRPTAKDVTFRLEVTQSSGAIAAESFRYDINAPVAATAPAHPAVQAKASPSGPTAPRPIHRVPPVVPSSIRPRIQGSIPIDVRVKVDRKGRVLSAESVTKTSNGLHKYLASRAVAAAKQWRFEPARDNGQPVAGEETLHFTFER